MGSIMLVPLLALIVLGCTITAMTRLQHEGTYCTCWKGLEILGWAFWNFMDRFLSITELWEL